VPLVAHGIVAKPLMNRSAPKWFHNVYTKNSKKMKIYIFQGNWEAWYYGKAIDD
jgi:hypothetical protein